MEIFDNKHRQLFVDANGIHENKDECKNDLNKEEIETAKVFINLFYVSRTTEGYFGSYSLKHSAENVGKYLNSLGAKTTPYVSNGAFIAAAFLSNIKIVHRGGLNCNFIGKFNEHKYYPGI
jgi:hypothetical protein